MPELTIDNQEIAVDAGVTILQAARQLGIEIPTLCYLEGHDSEAGCMVCAVKLAPSGQLVPACAVAAADGMVVESQGAELDRARRMALELLLSDHLGDCLSPCQRICPAGMAVPVMLRQVRADQWQQAVVTVKRDLALPAILGRVCHAPCENGCRRRSQDEAVAIRLVERRVADYDLASEAPYQPDCAPATGKKVAVVGAGPTGLTAAYHLLQEGHACTVFDQREVAGGSLSERFDEDRLPRQVIAAEAARIESLGTEFSLGAAIGGAASLEQLRETFDAVVLAVGAIADEAFGLPTTAKGIEADAAGPTGTAGVFAAGNAVRRDDRVVPSAAAGKRVAQAIHQFLSGVPVEVASRPFSCQIGRLREGEMAAFMGGASEAERVAPGAGEGAGFEPDEAAEEAARCVHCDCEAADDCRLRQVAADLGARPRRFHAERRRYERSDDHPFVKFEPGKCVHCGHCVTIAEEFREALGMTFVGRGFNVRVGVPFDEPLSAGLAQAAAASVEACPTSALCRRDDGPTDEGG